MLYVSTAGAQQAMDSIKKVSEFYIAFDEPFLPAPNLLDDKRFALKVRLLKEELLELEVAHADGSIVGVADALSDLQYILDGCFIEFGLADLKDKMVDEVHRSNMSKLDATGKAMRRADGKIIKGPNYRAPDLVAMILEPELPLSVEGGE